ncbi:hypothetical protein ACIQWR_40965 [Streptomyces sp. NPDC098789]|uniref:hypothetical protein n=1 Tax=Streptomyces sp. NPDC098789 TaxID=3366098 RepID=UPI003823CC0F
MSNDALVSKGKVDRRTPNFDEISGRGRVEMGNKIDSTEQAKGIFVQWELPAALRTGKERTGEPKAGPPADAGLAQPHLAHPDHGEFPLIPNRWLVARHSIPTDRALAAPPAPGRHQPAADTKELQFWLLRSDVPNTEDAGGRNDEDYTAALLPVVDQEAYGGYPSGQAYGAVYPLGDGTGEFSVPPEPEGHKAFLTVNSTGMPNFSSYQPYNQNILSFWDLNADLEKAQEKTSSGKGEITVSYLVVGWHSGSEDGLLTSSNPDIREAVESLGWSLPSSLSNEELSTTGTVYVGTVLGIPWNTNSDPATYRPSFENSDEFSLDGCPQPQNVGVAVGHSSVEACAAVIARTDFLSPAESRAFEAFQYGMMETPSKPGLPDHTAETLADYALQFAQLDAAFASLPGSRRWYLLADQGHKGPVPPILDAQTDALDQLNDAQARLDTANRNVSDLAARLKGLWWTTQGFLIEQQEITQKPTEDQVKAVKKLSELLKTAAEEQNSALCAVTDLSKKTQAAYAGTGRTLRAGPLPPFREVANPVVVLRNVQDPQRIHEKDGYLDGKLTVSLAENSGSTVSLTVSSKIKDLLSKPAADSIDGIVAQFEKLLEAVQSGVCDPQVNNKNARGTGRSKVFSEIASNDPYVRWWRQPWKPLYVEWTADLYPHHVGESHEDPSRLYTFTTKDTAPVKDTAGKEQVSQFFHQNLTGDREIAVNAVRTIKTGLSTVQPVVESHTRYRLRQAAEGAQSTKARAAYLQMDEQIANNKWDLLTTTLSGVNEALSGRKQDVHLPTRSALALPGKPDDLNYGPPSDPEKFATPDPKVLATRSPHVPLAPINPEDKEAMGDANFPEVRSAQLRLSTVRVHDAFGRILEADIRVLQVAHSMAVAHDTTNNVDTRSYTAVAASADSPNTAPSEVIDSTGLIDLPPRLMQSARLRFDYLTAPSPSRPRTPLCDLPDPSTGNPVHGWFMATRFGNRNALLCYDAQGQPLFDLHCLGPDSVATARPLPGNTLYTDPMSTGGKFQTDHPILYSFLKPLLGQGQGKGGLYALLSSLEMSLPAVSPPPPRGTDADRRAILIGRPVALATARLRLELDGPPLLPPTDEMLSGTKPRPAPTASPWPIVVGDPRLYTDGLLGYYLDGENANTNFNTFYTYHKTSSEKDPGNYTRKASPKDLPMKVVDASSSTEKDVHATLLLCPHHKVHAVTDLLPVAALSLPAHTLDGVLQNIRPALPLSSVLMTPSPTGSARHMPIPTIGKDTGTWVWTQAGYEKEKVSWTHHQISEIQPSDEALTVTTEAHSGYLQLTQKKDS